jgi:hypothetical protein
MIIIDRAFEARRVAQHNSYARRQMNLPATLTVDQWISNIETFGGMCAYCMKSSFVAMDHIYPTRLGGGTTVDNCVPVCRRCNTRKKNYAPFLSDAMSLIQKVESVRIMLSEMFGIRRRPTKQTILHFSLWLEKEKNVMFPVPVEQLILEYLSIQEDAEREKLNSSDKISKNTESLAVCKRCGAKKSEETPFPSWTDTLCKRCDAVRKAEWYQRKRVDLALQNDEIVEV